MSTTDLATLQVKLTWVGNQKGGRRSVVITAVGNAPNLSLYLPFRRPGLRYSNDGHPPLALTATVLELEALISGVGAIPTIADGDVDPGGYVSFALLNTSGGTTRAFEAVVNETTGPLLFDKLLTALHANPTSRKTIWEYGCSAGALPTALPEDLQGRVAITFSGFRRDPVENATYVGQVRVKNISTSTIAPPLSLVMIGHGNAELLDGHFTTCNIDPAGSEYVDLFISSGLAPGATVDQVIRFANPSRMKFDVTFRAFGGPGTR